ncbi:MAG: hypothetical protein WD851_14425 [Pirellulales bacterium]
MTEDDHLDPSGDPFYPPAISTLVHCIHCGQEYDSYRIEWRESVNSEGKRQGFWCCPMPGCDGLGFGFDIFPVDSEFEDERGRMGFFDDDEEDFDEDEEDDDDESWLEQV